MSDLWADKKSSLIRAAEPLAMRMRPRSLDEFVGQQHILGPGKLLARLLAADALTSLIIHGPPGIGKTTLAEVIALQSNRIFERENAAAVGVARIREIIATAQRRLADGGRRTALFLDEIHRFTRAQQDVLLGDVERGTITLIGATTENPLFAVNSALVSRSTLIRLEPLTEADIVTVLRRAMTDADRGFGKLAMRIDDDALQLWATKCDGDARRALTALEVAVLSSKRGIEANATAASASSPPNLHNTHLIHITRAIAEESIQQKAIAYDPTGDGHYDTISAFIKSVRASDPDAAIYWLAHMLTAGEDPRFIARRLAILASEDIGNADPRGIMIAQSCWELVERLGMPECRITLAQCTAYLALAPKSNASYAAIDDAMKDAREGRSVAIPPHIKDGAVRKATDVSSGGGHSSGGQRYQYTHEAGAPSPLLGVVGTQDYLGIDRRYYLPTDHGTEKLLKERLEEALRIRGRLK